MSCYFSPLPAASAVLHDEDPDMQYPLPWHLAGTVVLSLLVAACGTPSAPPERGDMQAAQRGKDCELTVQGVLEPSAVTALTLASDNLAKRSCRSKWAVLDIADGSVGTAFTVGSMLRNRGFNTRIKPGSTCLTTCLLVFAAGKEREIPGGPTAPRLGFSQIRPDDDFGAVSCQTELDNRQTLQIARYLRAMLPALTADYMLQEIRRTDCRGVRELSAGDAVTSGLATRR